MNKNLTYLKTEAERLGVADLCSPLLDDQRFLIWSGSSKPEQHHYGKGGLVEHVAQVAALCRLNNEWLGLPIDPRKLFVAALFHDAGKMWDYQTTDDYTNWEGSWHKRHIHHISRSAIFWEECVTRSIKYNTLPKVWSQRDTDEILHAILAHHGQREWGSPVSPNTKLAWMVFTCDMMSARTADAEQWDRLKDPNT